MAENTLNVLMPSVNNLTARVFVRAAGLDFEEVDVWGQTTTPEFLAKDPAHLTPLLEEAGLPRGTLWESCAIMQYLCNKHGLDQFYPTDPGERAMVDSAMFYLIGTLYPLLARATYPKLGFPSTRARRRPPTPTTTIKAQAQQDAEAALAEPLDAYRAFFLDGKTFIGGDTPLDRRHPPRRVARVPQRDRLPVPGLGEGVHVGGRVHARRRLLRARGGRARLRRVGEGLDDRAAGSPARCSSSAGSQSHTTQACAERRAGELERERVRIGAGRARPPSRARTRRARRPSAPRRARAAPPRTPPARGGRRRRRRPGRSAASPGHQPTATSCASIALRMMKSSDGGSAGSPENRFTARSNEPHHALTGVERPR